MSAFRDKLRRIRNLAISGAVYVLEVVFRALRQVTGKRPKAQCIVLYYHGIEGIHRGRFANQLGMILRSAEPIPAWYEGKLEDGHRYVALTFDDGLENFHTHALPELVNKRIPATVFVIAGALGKRLDWNPEFLDYYRRQKIMTAEQLKQLPPELITIGSHTLTHARLTALDGDDARAEICESRSQLELVVGRKIGLLSFPFGAYEQHHIETCRGAGYTRVFTSVHCAALSKPHEFVTGRVCVEPTDWRLEFHLKLRGAYCWMPYASRLKRSIHRGFRLPSRVSRPVPPQA